jgi:hypothetical protein
MGYITVPRLQDATSQANWGEQSKERQGKDKGNIKRRLREREKGFNALGGFHPRSITLPPKSIETDSFIEGGGMEKAHKIKTNNIASSS